MSYKQTPDNRLEGYVREADFELAYTVLTANNAETPVDLQLATNTLLGRLTGNIVALTGTQAAGIIPHNSLSGLQGGQSNEYYHLTAAEYSGLQTTFDDCYNNEGGAPTVIVDAGDVTFDLDGDYSFIISLLNTTNTGDGFQVNNNADYFQLNRIADNQIALVSELQTLDINIANVFSIDGASASNVSVTGAGLTISTITSGTLAVNSAGSLVFSDGNKSGSTYSGAFDLSSASSDWDDFEVNFGEVSLLEALNTLGDLAGLTDLDDAYNNHGGVANIAIDAGTVTWNLSSGYDFIVEAQNAGNAHGFIVNDTAESDYFRVVKYVGSSLNIEAEVNMIDFNAATMYFDGTTKVVFNATDTDSPVLIGTASTSGDQGNLVIQATSADGSTYAQVWKDSGEATVATLNSDGDFVSAATISATTAKLSNLTDGYLPYHVSDAAGLANSGLFWSSGNSSLGIGTTDFDGTPAIGRLVVKGSSNDGSTNCLVLRDSDEANVSYFDTDGHLYLKYLAINKDPSAMTGRFHLYSGGWADRAVIEASSGQSALQFGIGGVATDNSWIIGQRASDNSFSFSRSNDLDVNRYFIISTSGDMAIGTSDLDGTPAIGRLVVKGSTNDGSTNCLVLRDSDEANVLWVDTNGGIHTDQWLNQNSNTFIGVNTAAAGTLAHTAGNEGYRNTCIGNLASYSITTGYDNVAVGYEAARANTTGANILALGAHAGRYNATGTGWLAMGSYAGYSNTSSTWAGIGTNAAFANTSGQYWVAIGPNAAYKISGGADNTTCTDFVCIGYDTRLSADGTSNEIVIGTSAIGVGSNSVVLGNSSITTTILRGNTAIGTTDLDGTPAIGRLVVKGSTNDGSTNCLVLRDSDEANVFYIDTDGGGYFANRLGIATDLWGSYTATKFLIKGASNDASTDCASFVDSDNLFVAGIDTNGKGRFLGGLSVTSAVASFDAITTTKTNNGKHLYLTGNANSASIVYGLYCDISNGGAADAYPIYISAGTDYFKLLYDASNQLSLDTEFYDVDITASHDLLISQASAFSLQHDGVNYLETIAEGNKVLKYNDGVVLTDDAYFDLPSNSWGWVDISVETDDHAEYKARHARFAWAISGAPRLVFYSPGSSSYWDIADTDGTFCVFDNGAYCRVRNRLGSSRRVIFEYHYSTQTS